MQFEDKNIIEDCKKGKPKAQKAIYDKYSALLFGLCLRYCKNREDAKDVFQDSFIKAYHEIKKFKHKGSFEGWLRKLFINNALNYYRYDKSYSHVDEYLADSQNLNNNEIYDRFTNYEIMESIQKLSTCKRLVFNMVEIEGYSYKEVAEVLDISESTARNHNFKAKKELRKMLETLYK